MKKSTPIQPRIPVSKIRTITVRKRAHSNAPHLARLHIGSTVVLAAIGKAGISHRKREGDGASPAGSFRLMTSYFRSDRLARIQSLAGSRPLQRDMGWCDDPRSGQYNRPVQAGAKVSHERLWREDAIYDVLIPTTHNQRPRIRGIGSAIFLHLARPGYAATEGCVAINLADLRRMIPRLSPNATLFIAT
jgi:L,D-peptidoglycan transpeptidase YkuD (ErfK/YbiS/YcfS/YnhG family)